ncbi:CbtA family protein [Salinibaculum rarum]|uniref:CbtA family protein n=1 Tax=Salinibaculum rarum TaxID=3058903 RepID=UPI00265EB851|nr:CbtA family protein [Salinibaculum sp. KK48]
MLAATLTRGVKAGLVAGVVFALFVVLVANPLVVYADGLGHTGGAAHHGGGHHADGHHASIASMAISHGVSVASAALWGVLLGGVVFGVGFYFLEPAIPGSGATKSYILAAAGFVTVSGAPWLVLPPVSPGIEQSLATTTRLLWYGGMMVAGALTCLLSGYAYIRLSESRGRFVGVAGALAAFGLLAVPALLAPTSTTQGALPATLQSGIAGLVVFGQVLLWLALAATHAQLDTRAGAQVETSVDTSVTGD